MADPLQALEQALSIAAQKGDVAAARAITQDMQALLKAVNPNVLVPRDIELEGAKVVAKETGAGEAALIAAGRGVDKVKAGVQQAYNALPAYPLLEQDNQRAKDALAAEQGTKDRLFVPLAKEHPVSTAVGEAAPYAAIPASAGVLPAAATVGAIEASKYGTPGERTGRGVIGAGSTFIGGAAANAAAKVVAPVTAKAARPAHQGALEAAERIGMKPTLGESTGSAFIRRMEDAAARTPGGAGVMAEHEAANAVARNRAAARSIGEEADELTPEVFSRAAQRIGQVFEDIKATGSEIRVGPAVAAAADDVLRQQKKMLPTQQDANLIKIAEQARWAAQNRGRIDGETYQLTRSGLSDAAFDATGTNKVLYGKLLKAMDDSADASLRAAGKVELADALQTARPQWANLKILEKGGTAEAGNVSAPKVASTMRTNNPGAFRRGRYVGDEMGDIATVGEGLKSLQAGSPTYERGASLLNALWAYPIAKVATSPVATIYPRTIGKTAAARGAAAALEPSGRAAVAAALQQSGLLPPVTAEQR